MVAINGVCFAALPDDVLLRIWRCVYDGCVAQMDTMFADRCEWGRVYQEPTSWDVMRPYRAGLPSYVPPVLPECRVTMGRGVFVGMRRSVKTARSVRRDMAASGELFMPNTHYRSRSSNGHRKRTKGAVDYTQHHGVLTAADFEF